MPQIILSIVLGLHLLSAVIMIVRVIKTDLLTSPQKRINILLMVILPFIWPVLMYYMLKKEPVVFDEEKQHEHTSHHFYESGKAFYH